MGENACIRKKGNKSLEKQVKLNFNPIHEYTWSTNKLGLIDPKNHEKNS